MGEVTSQQLVRSLEVPRLANLLGVRLFICIYMKGQARRVNTHGPHGCVFARGPPKSCLACGFPKNILKPTIQRYPQKKGTARARGSNVPLPHHSLPAIPAGTEKCQSQLYTRRSRRNRPIGILQMGARHKFARRSKSPLKYSRVKVKVQYGKIVPSTFTL